MKTQTNSIMREPNGVFTVCRLLAFGVLLTPMLARGQVAVQAWAQRYNGMGNGGDGANAVAVDSSGNVFVTGFSWSGFNTEYATVKYSGTGVPLWTNRWSMANENIANDIALDTDGNVFVTGNSGSYPNYDWVTIAHSNAGVPLWTNRYNGPGNDRDEANAMAVDTSGNVIVAGFSYNADGGYDYATIAYSNAGVPLWTNRYNGPGNNLDIALAIALDSSNNVFVTGWSYSGSANTSADYATVAYSSAGVPLWTNRYNGPGNSEDYAVAIAVDGTGNVFVTGASDTGGFNYGYATVAYSNAGLPLWTNRYGPGRAGSVAVGGSGNLFVTGYSSAGGYDYATIAYSDAGVPLWTNKYNGPANDDDIAAAVGVDSSGTVFVTGQSWGNPGPAMNKDFATIAYSNSGVPLWTNRYDGPPHKQDEVYTRRSLAVTGIGSVVVVGLSDGTSASPSEDYAIVKYVTLPPQISVTSQTNATVQVSWLPGYIGWRLEMQTNGLGTNWITVTDSTKTNRMSMPVGSGNSSAFFRLATP